MVNEYNTLDNEQLEEELFDVENTQNNISSFTIDTSDIPAAATNRMFTVSGTSGGQFKMIVLQNPSSSPNQTLYYNWKSRSFSAGHNSLHNDLIVSLPSNIYNNSIIFS